MERSVAAGQKFSGGERNYNEIEGRAPSRVDRLEKFVGNVDWGPDDGAGLGDRYPKANHGSDSMAPETRTNADTSATSSQR